MKKTINLLIQKYKGYQFIFEIVGYATIFYLSAYVLFNFAFLFRP
jgi:hypothetical protein